MDVNIGGDRLGSGNKQKVSLRNYERSTHDLSYLWRSTMSAGTLVPFMSEVALPGDNFDIELNCEVLTLPTIGPLFGSYKVQLDVFEVPIRLYQAGLHMNRLGIGMDMSQVYLPQVAVKTNNHSGYVQTYDDNEQVNPSALIKYLGISGIGNVTNTTNPAIRYFNAVPLLGYWDIYKNYYSNKQEERGFVVHTSSSSLDIAQTPEYALYYYDDELLANLNTAYAVGVPANNALVKLVIQYRNDALEPETPLLQEDGNADPLTDAFSTITWDDDAKQIIATGYNGAWNSVDWETELSPMYPAEIPSEVPIKLEEFALSQIDDMREDILQFAWNAQFGIGAGSWTDFMPYTAHLESIGADDAQRTYSAQYSQEGLGVKTYQSDLFNNWISTEWIDGTGGVNEISAVSTAGDEFTIDALNLAQKVYIMLNRIAISGGSYDDWLDAVYTHERVKSVESPVYYGSLIKELAFQEVISNANATGEDGEQPLGTLAGRGRLTNKHKGGKINIRVNEPSYIIGIVSLTPRIDYSQGNKWDVNLTTMNDLHKPALDAIGYQDLITEQMVWSTTNYDSTTQAVTYESAGKQPAWINYMTNYNRVYGNFADQNKEMFMTLNRRYEKTSTGSISDLTTYIDPSKFNHIFAQTTLDAQNFWVQISNNITARRKMSAKVIPNL